MRALRAAASRCEPQPRTSRAAGGGAGVSRSMVVIIKPECVWILASLHPFALDDELLDSWDARLGYVASIQ